MKRIYNKDAKAKKLVEAEFTNMAESRFIGLTEQIDFYMWLKLDNGFLSEEQKAHCKKLKNTIIVFGRRAKKWATLCDELINNTMNS